MTTEAATLSKLIEGNGAPEGLFFGRLSAVSTAAVGPIVVLGWFCQAVGQGPNLWCGEVVMSVIEPEIEMVDRTTRSIRYLEHGYHLILPLACA